MLASTVYPNCYIVATSFTRLTFFENYVYYQQTIRSHNKKDFKLTLFQQFLNYMHPFQNFFHTFHLFDTQNCVHL